MKNLEVNTLNINSNSLLNIATFRQEDNATLMLELYKNGQSIDLTGQKIILGAERSDGSIIEQEEDISTNENIVTIKLKKNILAVNGLVKMQLTLSDREGTMSTTSFNINVDRKILGAENIKASNDIETINSLVLDLKTNVNKAITDTKDKASTLLSGLEDTANSVELKVNALTDISNGLLKNLENQCKDSTIINTELSNNIQQALPINTELKENIKIGQPLVIEATSKNTELQASLEETRKYIDGLDGSQDIPGIRMELTELQNGLKSNQSLEYNGSSITANDTLEGRTEGMKIKGMTLVNVIPKGLKSYKNLISGFTFEGDTLVIQGSEGYLTLFFKDFLFKPNTKYTVIADIKEINFSNDNWRILMVGEGDGQGKQNSYPQSNPTTPGLYKASFTTPNVSITTVQMFTRPSANGKCAKINSMMVLEGDWTNKEIPNYFEGIKSFGEAEQEGDKYKISILSSSLSKIKFEQGTIDSSHGNDVYVNNRIKSNFIDGNFESIKNTNLDFNKFMILLYTYDSSKRFIKTTTPEWVNYIDIDNIPSNTKYMRILIKYKDDSNIGIDISKSIYFGINDKKDILISAPLPGFDFGEDIIYEENGQVKITRNIDNYIFTGDETMRDTTEQDEKSGTGKYKVFALTVNKTIDINKNINNNFPKKQFNVAFQNMDNEGLAVTQYGVYIKILKSKLSTQDTEGFKAWLKANTTTIYFSRATPVTEIVENCVDIDLETYQEKTCFNILNSLSGTLDFKVPSNIASIVQNTAKEVNNIWDIINNVLVPSIVKANGNLAMIKLNNNLN